MITILTLNILGLTAGIIGTIILAISLGRLLKALRLSVTAHEIFIESFTSGGNVVKLTGTDLHIARGSKNAATLTFVGLLLVITGFVLQLLQYLPFEWTTSFISR